ncbi:MAG: hypothetical protein ABFD96_01990 [Armatimonadia bacterium]
MDKAEIQHRIEELKQERDRFVTQANLQLANYTGQIQALEGLIAPVPEASAKADPE